MSHGENKQCRCGGPAEILADLIDEDLLDLQPGERLWKLYCFRDAGHPTALRHRIYTKEKTDGRLALLTFAVHNPPRDNADPDGAEPVRSALARVPDLSAADLDRLISAVRVQTGSDSCEEVDLSGKQRLADQIVQLRRQIGS